MTTAPLPQQTMPDPQVANLLSQLNGPLLPDPVGVWPPAPGWWALCVLSLFLAAAIVFLLRRRRQNTGYRKTAIQMLATLSQTDSDQEFTTACAALLKQTFITAVPNARPLIASLYGQTWLQLLHRTCELGKLPFEQQQALTSITGEAKYQPNCIVNRRDLEQACRYWINKHKRISIQQLHQLLQQTEAN